MNRLKKIVLSKPFVIATAVILTYTLAGFLLAPFLVKRYAPGIVHKELKKQASIGDVRVNPYLFTFEANGFQMGEPDGQPIVGFKQLFIDFELKSLFKWAWTFREIRIEGPELNAVIHNDGSLNLASLAPPSDASLPQNKDDQPTRLIFEEIVIDQGRIDFTDRRQSAPASITLKPLNLRMKNLTTLPGEEGEKSITATSGDGETFKWTGAIGLNPPVTRGSFSIENLRIATLWEFARDALNLEQPAGKFSISTDYSVDLGNEVPQVELANLSIALSDIILKLQGAETPLLELPDTRINGGRLDLSSRQADIGRIALNGGRTRIAVNADGTLNLQQIAKASEAAAPTDPSPAVPGNASKPWKITLNALDLGGFAAEYMDLSRTPGLRAGVAEIKVGLTAEAEAGNPIRGLINDITIAVAGVQAGFADATEPALRVDAVALEEGAFDFAANRLSAGVISVEGGSIDVQRQADGNINLALLFAPPPEGALVKTQDEAAAKGPSFQFLVKTVSLSGLQAAFSDLAVRADAPLVTLDPVSVTAFDVDGKSPMKFNSDIAVREGGRIKAAGIIDPSAPSVESAIDVAALGLLPLQPYIDRATALVLTSGVFSTRGNLRHGIKIAGAQTVYQGGFKIENLHVTEVGGSEPLVGWQSVQSEQLKLQLEPNGIDIGDIRVLQPVGKVIIEADGALNLARAIKSGAQEEEKPATADTADSFPYRVRRVLISDGRAEFADLSLPIPFGTKIHELQGNLTGISSTPNTRAQVKLDGRVDEYGTARVEGELDTSNPKAFTDISVVFRNVEMSRLTPYSGKFAGRRIDSGKLSVDLKYKIDESRLAGENQVVVERLTLGEKIESPDAVNLPLNLAVALLEDANGVIDLGLPVRGNLDSPEFSFGALIGKAILNLLTKIVTSPFRALAALIPGLDEEAFKTVAFEPGSTRVPPPEKENLARLAGALQKRPQLKLAVQGRYNPESDRAVLRNASLRRTLAARLGQNLAPGMDPGPVDFSSPETGQALESLFSERFGVDALNALKAELTAADEKVKKEAAAKDKTAAPKAAVEDPGRLAKLLFIRLEEVEPVDEAELVQLADARALAVIAELSGPQAISAERLTTMESAALQISDPVTVELTLEALR